MNQNVTLEKYLSTATHYLIEGDDYGMEEEKEPVEEAIGDDELGDEGAEDLGDESGEELGDDEGTEELPAEDDLGEELGDEEGSEELGDEDDLGGEEEIEELSDEDITIKDVSDAVKTLAKNLALTQKKIGGINFGGITFQKQSEVLEALKNVYNSAKGFANEMSTFNSLEWK
jgi:hypothetical protein